MSDFPLRTESFSRVFQAPPDWHSPCTRAAQNTRHRPAAYWVPVVDGDRGGLFYFCVGMRKPRPKPGLLV